MDSGKARKLRAAGWRIGSTQDFLGLTEEEDRLLQLRLGLVEALRSARTRAGLSQAELAERMNSSQSRVAKIEAGDPSVSLDLIVKALIAAGASDGELARAFKARARRQAGIARR